MSKRYLAVVAALIVLGVAAWIYSHIGPKEEGPPPPEETAQRELVESPKTEVDESPASEQATEYTEHTPGPEAPSATVQMRARVVGSESSPWLLLRATQSEPARRIYPIVGDANSASSEADLTTGEFNTSIQVACDEVLHLGVYSRLGDLLGSTSTARGLEPDEVFLWEPVFDLEGLYRDYYFSIHLESVQGFPDQLAERFQVDVFDVGAKLWLESSSYDYQADKVYRLRVPSNRSVLAQLNQFDPGIAGWTVDPSEGRNEREPALIRLGGRVRVLVPNEVALEADRYRNQDFNLMTDTLGVTTVPGLEPLADGLNHELTGLYSNTTSFRIGQRFYRCAFSEGGEYALGDPSIVEVYAGELARLQLTLENDPGPDTQVFWRIKSDQVQLSKQALPFVYLGRTAQFEVPVGTIRVEARLGIDGSWVSASIEVPRQGTEHRLVLPD